MKSPTSRGETGHGNDKKTRKNWGRSRDVLIFSPNFAGIRVQLSMVSRKFRAEQKKGPRPLLDEAL